MLITTMSQRRAQWTFFKGLDAVYCSLDHPWLYGFFFLLQYSIVNLFFQKEKKNWRTMVLLLSLQLCPTLCDPIDGSPPGSPVPGILQARTLEWVAISFSNEWKWKVKVKSLSHIRFFVTPWTAAYQGPPPMGFSRQEYWVGCHCLLCEGL